jgi:hypothetical protein
VLARRRPGEKVIECGIYRTDAGLEVRCDTASIT